MHISLIMWLGCEENTAKIFATVFLQGGGLLNVQGGIKKITILDLYLALSC